VVKFTKRLLLGTLVLSGTVDAGIIQKAKDARATVESYTRDRLLEGGIAGTYLFNKYVVEADKINYPKLVALVQKISTKADINQPIIFVITNKDFSYAAKANASACGDKNRSVLVVGN